MYRAPIITANNKYASILEIQNNFHHSSQNENVGVGVGVGVGNSQISLSTCTFGKSSLA